MGNQPSSSSDGVSGGGTSSSTSNKVRGFMNTRGLLGLSKTELDERCKPSGLYPSCQWEDKAVRKLIGDGKLAARLRGTEHRATATDRECPICFLQYREVNTTKCCSAFLCTECYLQVRPQKAKAPCCPFCNHNRFGVTVATAMNAEAMLLREETEQKVIEAKIRSQQNQQANQQNQQSDFEYNTNNVDVDGKRSAHSDTPNSSAPSSTNGGFGSSLEQHERIATLRARSNSNLSDHHEHYESIPEDVLRSSFAMTPEERRLLEDEMRNQNSHPLSLRLQAEAEERRLQNERDFLRNNPTHAFEAAQLLQHSRSSGGRSRRGGSNNTGRAEMPRRNWNQIVEAFERGGHGEVNSLDDLVVLEAAMILSMEEESRRRGGGGGNGNDGTAGNNGEADGGPFDASRHANEGFPLVRSILSGRQSGTRGGGGGEDPNASEQIQSLANSLYNSRRRSGRSSLLRAAYGGGGDARGGGGGGGGGGTNHNHHLDTAMDTAGLLMRGISEEDQLAMAIAASLQESQPPQEQQQQQEGEVNEDANEDGGNDTADGEAAAAESTAAATNDQDQAAAEGSAETANEQAHSLEETADTTSAEETVPGSEAASPTADGTEAAAAPSSEDHDAADQEVEPQPQTETSTGESSNVEANDDDTNPDADDILADAFDGEEEDYNQNVD